MNINVQFSIIIPTFHRNELLVKCLERLCPETQTLPFEKYEVIVTDDGKESTAKELVQEKYPWVKWVEGPHKGPAANRNNGAKHAEGSWLVFTDDDCLPDSRWLIAYEAAIKQNSGIMVFEGKTYSKGAKQSLAEVAPINETGGFLWSCNFSIHNKLFRTMGGFYENFPYAAMEDVDFRLRLVERKEEFIFVPNASVCHPWRLMGGWKVWKNHQKSTLVYLSKHPQELQRINSAFYLKLIVYDFSKNVLPEIFKGKFKGIQMVFIQYVSFFEMSIKLLFYRFNSLKK